jgi:O-antigen/teichoic acid export membrane protein
MLQSAFYKVCYTVLVFLANLLLANLVAPAHFGMISLMIINAAIIQLITGLGADSLIIHSLSNNKWSLPLAVSFALYAFFIQLVIFLLLQLAHLQIWGNTLLAQADKKFLASEIFYFIGLIGTERYVTLFYSENKASVANWLLLCAVSVYLIALVLLRSLHLATFEILFYLFCLQSFLQACLLFMAFHFKERLYSFMRIKWAELYVFFKLSFVVMITNFIQFFAYRIDFLLLKRFYSDYEVGIYAQVNKFANLIWVIPNIFAFLLMPRFQKLKDAEVLIVFRYAVLSGLALVLITTFATKIFYAYFVNPEYRSGLPSFYLMLPGYFCWSVVLYFAAYFSWRGLFYNNLLLSSFCFIAMLVCDLLLIPHYSIQGAAVANSIAYGATFILYVVLFSRALKVELSEIFHLQKSDFSLIAKLVR